jgi:hypothetical protein
MKVIIQDLETNRYFAPSGRWVMAPDAAENFYSILPAYHFAKQNVSGRFKVILYCADDQYSKSIIEGVGQDVGEEISELATPYTPVKAAATFNPRKALAKPSGVIQIPIHFGADRSYLN